MFVMAVVRLCVLKVAGAEFSANDLYVTWRDFAF